MDVLVGGLTKKRSPVERVKCTLTEEIKEKLKQHDVHSGNSGQWGERSVLGVVVGAQIGNTGRPINV